MNPATSGRLLVLAAAILFSTGGAAIKAASLTAWQVACFRSAVAAAVIFLLLPDSRQGWSWRQAPVALAQSATLVLFVYATKLTTAGNAIFLQNTAPLFLLLISPLVLREAVRRSDLAFMGAVAAGMALFFVARESAQATAPNPYLGNILAAASALTWALTIAGLRWIGTAGAGVSGLGTVALGNLVTAAVTAPFAFPVGGVALADIAIIMWLGLFQVALAYVCLTRGVRSVAALEASTILLVEPALNPTWAWLVHAERPTSLSIAGGALILTATFAKAWWQNRGR